MSVRWDRELVRRYTFVLHVHPGGISTLENLTTGELIQVENLATVGAGIEAWLATLDEEETPTITQEDPA